MHTCPFFDEESGSRFALVRMRMLMDQRSMGELLGVSQQQISQLERGRLAQPPFNMARFKAVFGDFYSFVLLGSQPKREMNPSYVTRLYWETKLKTRRKQGSGLWKKEESLTKLVNKK